MRRNIKVSYNSNNMQTCADILSSLADMASHLIAPKLCPVCGRPLMRGETALCLQCLGKLPRCATDGHTASMTTFVSNGVAPAGFTAAWFIYNPLSPFADLIRGIKYGDRPRLGRELGRIFGREMLASASPGLPWIAGVDVLLPVPSHFTKRMRRGFNQSVEIARGISDATGIPVADNLRARKAHYTQTRKSATERRNNLDDTMVLDSPHELDGLHTAIVDDIVTTGATAGECVRAISVSGAHPATIGLISLGLTIAAS